MFLNTLFPLILFFTSHHIEIQLFFFFTFSTESCLIKVWSKMFSRTEELKKSPLALIRASLAQYSVSGSGHRRCCWGDHGASCSSLPDTLSASMSAVSRIVCPSFQLPCLKASVWTCWSCLPPSAPCGGPRSPEVPNPQWEEVLLLLLLPTPLCCESSYQIFLSWGLSTTSTVSRHLSYPPSFPNLKNPFTFGKKQQQPLPQKKEKSKAQTQPKLPNKEQEQESFASVLSGTYLTVVLQMCNFLDFI